MKERGAASRPRAAVLSASASDRPELDGVRVHLRLVEQNQRVSGSAAPFITSFSSVAADTAAAVPRTCSRSAPRAGPAASRRWARESSRAGGVRAARLSELAVGGSVDRHRSYPLAHEHPRSGHVRARTGLPPDERPRNPAQALLGAVRSSQVCARNLGTPDDLRHARLTRFGVECRSTAAGTLQSRASIAGVEVEGQPGGARGRDWTSPGRAEEAQGGSDADFQGPHCVHAWRRRRRSRASACSPLCGSRGMPFLAGWLRATMFDASPWRYAGRRHSLVRGARRAPADP
jgi:hypothetical protein